MEDGSRSPSLLLKTRGISPNNTLFSGGPHTSSKKKLFKAPLPFKHIINRFITYDQQHTFITTYHHPAYKATGSRSNRPACPTKENHHDAPPSSSRRAALLPTCSPSARSPSLLLIMLLHCSRRRRGAADGVEQDMRPFSASRALLDHGRLFRLLGLVEQRVSTATRSDRDIAVCFS